MKTKQEVIKEAYGDVWESIKERTNKNGWVEWRKGTYNLFKWFRPLDVEQRGNLQRLKSLTGIEHNNGWIRIESEEDLPNEFSECYVYDDEDDITYFNFGIKSRSSEYIYLKEQGITHYQPIVKPKPPLY